MEDILIAFGKKYLESSYFKLVLKEVQQKVQHLFFGKSKQVLLVWWLNCRTVNNW